APGDVCCRLHDGQTASRAHFRSRASVAREPGEVAGEISTTRESAPARGQTSVMRYQHTQIGHVIIWSLLAIILITSGALIGPYSNREPPLVVSIILLVCLALFYKLTVTIDDETLCASFGPCIIRKRVRLAEI